MALDHGLSDASLTLLARTIAQCGEGVTRVDLFGSRATGAHRANSDIDLALHGDVTDATIDRLRTMFLESSLPVSVDVTSYERAYPPLRRHIDAVARFLLSVEDLKAARRGEYDAAARKDGAHGNGR